MKNNRNKLIPKCCRVFFLSGAEVTVKPDVYDTCTALRVGSTHSLSSQTGLALTSRHRAGIDQLFSVQRLTTNWQKWN